MRPFGGGPGGGFVVRATWRAVGNRIHGTYGFRFGLALSPALPSRSERGPVIYNTRLLVVREAWFSVY